MPQGQLSRHTPWGEDGRGGSRQAEIDTHTPSIPDCHVGHTRESQPRVSGLTRSAKITTAPTATSAMATT